MGTGASLSGATGSVSSFVSSFIGTSSSLVASGAGPPVPILLGILPFEGEVDDMPAPTVVESPDPGGGGVVVLVGSGGQPVSTRKARPNSSGKIFFIIFSFGTL